VFALTNSANARAAEKITTAEQQSTLTPPIPGTFLTGPNEGQPLAIAFDFIQKNRATLQLSTAEISNLVVKDQYLSRKSGITHIYLIQTHNGIELYNAVLNINIGRDGSIINIGSRIVPDLTSAVQETEPEISAVNALQNAAEHLNLELGQPATTSNVLFISDIRDIYN
jgi:Zn-dependent metalloprotease